MIVSGLPTFIVLIIAVLITVIYYKRYKNTWMIHWLVVLLVFSINFLFFAYGIVAFIVGEIIRHNIKNKSSR